MPLTPKPFCAASWMPTVAWWPQTGRWWWLLMTCPMTFAVPSYSSAPTGTVSAVVAVTIALPATPVGFTAVAAGSGISLSWSDPTKDATSFELIRATNMGFTQNVQSISLSSATTQFTDSSATPGQTYYYEVQALAGSGVSALASIMAVHQ